VKQRRFHPLLALAVVAALLLGACSSGGDDDAKDDTTTTEAPATTGGEDAGDEGDETTTTEGGSNDPVEVDAGGQAYVDAMVQSMRAEDDFPLSDDQAQCFASRFVNTIGVDRLNAAGVTPEMIAGDDDSMEFTELDLSEDEGNELYDQFGECNIDLREMFLQSMAADEDVSPAMQSCMETVLTDDNLRKLMVTTMVYGDDEVESNPELEELVGGLMGCAFMGMDAGDFDVETGDLGEG
jgi:hypothetical protein